jgi:hypothetical protein
MRHAFVTMLAEEEVHERVAQQLAGHADSRTTRDIYTHVTGSMLGGAVDAMERAAGRLHDVGSPNGSLEVERGADGQARKDGKAP